MLKIERVILGLISVFELLSQTRQYIISNSKFCSMSTKAKVFSTRRDIPEEGINKVKEECDIEIHPKIDPMTEQELLKKVPGKAGRIYLITTEAHEALFPEGKQLKVNATMSTGNEHVDLNECKKSMSTKAKVFITRRDIPEEGINKVKEECDVEIHPKIEPITKQELLKKVPGKDGLFCLLTDEIDKDVISAGKQLKVISTMSVGYEHIDLNECKKRNIQVSNTPDVSSDSVAEWTVMLMLNAGRKFLQAATAIKQGEWIHSWRPVWLTGIGLKDAVVGIVGMGRIGQGVMKRVLPFGVKKVLYYDVFHPIKPAEEMGAVFAEFEELLKESDFVVCMCNLSEETRNIFNKKAFGLMKSEAVFVNTSRGGVVNQKDLYAALKSKQIRAAGIDVTIPEPLPKDHELTTLPNLIVTPHVASAETNVRITMSNLAAENILLGVNGKPLKTPVPMPK